MSAADRPAGSGTAGDAAATLRGAEFVGLVAAADGDALAAAGLLARALAEHGVPFQASVVGPTGNTRSTEADATIAVGRDDPAADLSVRPSPCASAAAFEIARALEADPDPRLALAGATVAGVRPPSLVEAVEAAGAVRRPGVAVPTADLADGLVHSTLVHAPFSGDPGSAGGRLDELDLPADLDEDARRRVASLVAVAVAGDGDTVARAAGAVERALRPHAVDGPFDTVGGYGDVLDAVARERPGTGVALALGHDARAPALESWRTHGRRAHAALRAATTGRYDGLFVARAGAGDLGLSDPAAVPTGTAARLLRDFRSPEPVALFVTDGGAGAAAADRDLAGPAREAAGTLGAASASTSAGGRRARVAFETDTAEFITAFREAL